MTARFHHSQYKTDSVRSGPVSLQTGQGEWAESVEALARLRPAALPCHRRADIIRNSVPTDVAQRCVFGHVLRWFANTASSTSQSASVHRGGIDHAFVNAAFVWLPQEG